MSFSVIEVSHELTSCEYKGEKPLWKMGAFNCFLHLSEVVDYIEPLRGSS